MTFFFTPQASIFGYGAPGYTAEAGVYGSLTPNGGCGAVAAAGSAGGYICFPSGRYDPPGYDYRDPYGRVYTIQKDMSDGGKFKLTGLSDLNGNQLVFDDGGVKARNTAGNLNGGNYLVSFTRNPATDPNCPRCITKITDPAGKDYLYDVTTQPGDLTRVTLPGLATPISYTYYTGTLAHFFQEAFDPRGNRAVTTSYDSQGRLAQVVQPVGGGVSYTTGYTYDIPNNTTTVTNPDGGKLVSQTDPYGKTISETMDVGSTSGASQRTTRYSYDAAHQLLQTSLPDPTTGQVGSRTLSYSYDGKGNQTAVTNTLGFSSTTLYNVYGGPTALTDQGLHRYNVGYDPNFLPTVVSDTLGNLGGYSFDERGSVLSRSDGNGNLTSYSYDQYGNKVSETSGLGQSNLFGYDNLGRMTVMTDAVGNLTRYSYDPLGRMLLMTATLSGVNYVTSYSYDPNGNQTQVIQPGNRTSSYEYDQANRLTKITLPNPTTGTPDATRTLQYSYDWRGNKLTETDQLGRITKYEYDLAGQLITTTYALGTPDTAKMVASYDAAGRKASETNANLRTTLYSYDAGDRLLNVQVPLYQSGSSIVYATTSYNYDAVNRKTIETDPNGRQTRFDYDYRGRLITTTYATLSNGTILSTTQSYDGAGNLQQKRDQAGTPTNYGYDQANRLTSVINALNQVTSYRYDPVGRLLSITDARLNHTNFEYDLWGRQVKKIWPDGSYEGYGYDEVGNQTVVTTTQVSGQTAQANTFAYNKLNQLTQANYFDGRTVSYSYTLNGQRQSVTDSLWGTTTYGYTQRDQVNSIVGPGSGGAARSLAYSYDPVGNRTVMAATVGPTQSVTSYSYDFANRLSGVSNPSHFTGSATYSYNPIGLRTQLALPNGVNVSYTYDELNRLTNITQSNGSGNLASYTYQLGAAGNRTKVTELGGNSVEWGYDATYRLTNETRKNNGGAVLTATNFTYDVGGNRQTQAIQVGSLISTTNYSYNELDQLKSVLSGGINTTYSYDRRGNLTNVGSTTSYTWDAADRMTGATVPGGSANYTYDADGRRVRQVSGGNTTNYLWDEQSQYGDVVLEADIGNNAQTSYVLNGVAGELISQKKSNVLSFFLKDGQGSTRMLVNSSGSVDQSYNYDAFGTLQNSTTTPNTSYLYTGQQFDAFTVLYDLRARYYNPQQGRFLGRDPVAYNYTNPIEVNRYGYVASNPITRLDPEGKELFDYSQVTQIGKKVSPALARFGGEVANLVIEEVVNFLIGNAEELFIDFLTNYLTGGSEPPLTFAYGEAELENGKKQRILTISDFHDGSYPDGTKSSDWIKNKKNEQELRRFKKAYQDRGWIVEGGVYHSGTSASNLHAEDYMEKVANNLKLKPGTNVLAGQNNYRGFCSRCAGVNPPNPHRRPMKSKLGMVYDLAKEGFLFIAGSFR